MRAGLTDWHFVLCFTRISQTMNFDYLHTRWFPDKIPMVGRTANTKEERVANFKLAFDV
jgi:hypothetical protein